MKYKIKTRDWKGTYGHMADVEGWVIVGGEDDIETGGDCFALVFCSGKKPDLNPQEAYDLYQLLNDVDDISGYHKVRGEQNTIERIPR